MADNLEEMRDAIQDAMTYAWMISQEDANAQLDALEAAVRADQAKTTWCSARAVVENYLLGTSYDLVGCRLLELMNKAEDGQ